MIPALTSTDNRLDIPLTASRSRVALQSAGAGSSLGECPPAEDARFPLTDFAWEKPGLASHANIVAMKTAAWLAIILRRFAGSRSRGRMGILTYHRMSPRIKGFPPPTHNVTPDRFRAQVAGLLDRGFAIWPVAKLLRYHASGSPTPPRTIALTFDDGFQSVYVALKCLREIGPKVP